MGDRRFVLLAAVLLLAGGVALADEAVATKNFNEGVTAPYLIPTSRVAPQYPAAAFDARMEGHVTVAALVLKDGSVDYVEALDTSAPSLGFEKAAIDAVRQWRFEPGQFEGEAIDAFAVVRLSFRRTTGAYPTGFVTAAFAPPEMLGASIVADMTSPSSGAVAASGSMMSSVMDPERGPYHPRIPPNLGPGGSYARTDWWPSREHNLSDGNGRNDPRLDVN